MDSNQGVETSQRWSVILHVLNTFWMHCMYTHKHELCSQLDDCMCRQFKWVQRVSLVLSVLFKSHLYVWLTNSSSDWRQNSPGLCFHKTLILTKVMSIMKKVLTNCVCQSSCPWWQVVVTHSFLFQCKVFILELQSKQTYPLITKARCFCVFAYTQCTCLLLLSYSS